jgi:hypothetical protein
MLSLKELSPAQIGSLAFAGIWSTFIPGYFQPDKFHKDQTGGVPPTKCERLYAMEICGFCGFFGLTCALAATDKKSARLVMIGQTAMCAFFFRFNTIVTPQWEAFTKEKVKFFQYVWGASLAIALTSLGFDYKMTV